MRGLLDKLASRLPTGLLGQGVRYVIAGGAATFVYLLSTLTLADVLDLPFELALALGFGAGLSVHFTLQRLFVWTHQDQEYTLPFHHQVGRYLLLSAAQYGITAVSVGLLPAALGLPTEVVYVATVALTASTNFLVFRYGIFHSDSRAARSVLKVS